MNQSKFPPGWDEDRVNRILRYYEEQSEAEALAEDEAAFTQTQTTIAVPNELVPTIRELLAKHQIESQTR